MAATLDRFVAYDDLKFLIKNGLSEVIVTSPRHNSSSNDIASVLQTKDVKPVINKQGGKSMTEPGNNKKRPAKKSSNVIQPSSGKKSPVNKESLSNSSDSSQPSKHGSARATDALSSRNAAEYTEGCDMKDEMFWAALPQDQIVARFRQYRNEAVRRLQELEDDLDSTIQKTEAKLDVLMSQFTDQKGNWQTERSELLNTIDTARKYHAEAEEDVDCLMRHVSDFLHKFSQLEFEKNPTIEQDTEKINEISSNNVDTEETVSKKKKVPTATLR